jgi:cytidylate kinase
MSVVTSSREFGSEGDAIATQAAHILGYHYVDKALIGSLLSQYGLVEFDKEYDVLPGFWERFNAQREQGREQMAGMLDQVVRAVAQHGNVVIVGRSGFAVLHDFADVLNVRVQSPLAARISRVMAQQNLTAEQAEHMVVEADRVRARFIELFYKARWDSTSAFDLVLDTSKVAPELAVTWVVQAAQALAGQPPTGQPTCNSLQVDPVLARAVADALRCEIAHR